MKVANHFKHPERSTDHRHSCEILTSSSYLAMFCYEQRAKFTIGTLGDDSGVGLISSEVKSRKVQALRIRDVAP